MAALKSVNAEKVGTWPTFDEGKNMKIAALALLLIGATITIATESLKPSSRQELSGILQKQIKSEFNYSLQLDGMTGSIDVTGAPLDSFKAGDRIYVKGIIKTKLNIPKYNQTEVQQPVHWVIYMEVEEAKAIKSLFGLHETNVVEQGD